MLIGKNLNKINKLQAIQGLGNLITWYKSDLDYITLFKRYKENHLEDTEYLKDKKGFQKFINEYRVARNIKKEKVIDCMRFTKKYVTTQNYISIDDFALALKNEKITQDGKVMTSLASKLLFLNDPENVFIIDRLNRRAVKEKTNNHKNFKKKVEKFQQINIKIIQKHLTIVDVLLKDIEKHYKDLKINFEKYRITRYTDKILWTLGR